MTGSWALGVGPEGAVLYGAVVQREDKRVKYGEALSWCRRLVAPGLGTLRLSRLFSMHHLPHKSPMQVSKFQGGKVIIHRYLDLPTYRPTLR